MKGAASWIRHEEDKKKKNRDFEYDYFPSILGTNFQSGLKIPFLIIRSGLEFFGVLGCCFFCNPTMVVELKKKDSTNN
jgi:hypothetical protein